MTDYNLSQDTIATIPLTFADQFGNTLPMPTNVTIANSNEATGTAVLSGSSVVLTPIAVGSFVVTVASGSISADLNVTVSAAALVSITFDVAHATVTPKPAA